MTNRKLTSKVRKKLGMPAPSPVRVPKVTHPKIQAQPSSKGCCGGKGK